MATELHEYIKRAKEEPSRENLREMWRRIFMLKGWYLLPAEDREGPNRPAVLEYEDDQCWLPICTDVRRFQSFAKRAGRVDGEGEVNMLVLSPPDSMKQIQQVDAALEGVVFNPGTDATVRAPIEALERFAEEFDIHQIGPAGGEKGSE